MLYEKQGKYDEALKFYIKSIESHRLNGDTTEFSKPLLDIGNVYAQTGRFKEALNYYQ
jgi:tetratricopeptide (TPR) repeat protein